VGVVGSGNECVWASRVQMQGVVVLGRAGGAGGGVVWVRFVGI
jgi:hypothetical protein